MSCSFGLSEKEALEEAEVHDVCLRLGTVHNADTIALRFVCLWVGCRLKGVRTFVIGDELRALQGRSKSSQEVTLMVMDQFPVLCLSGWDEK